MSLALTVTEVRFPPLSPLMTILTTLHMQATQVMKLGRATDFGICSSVEDGNPCTAVVDTY
jgi:ABC-type polysaccharide transport system permease subunit